MSAVTFFLRGSGHPYKVDSSTGLWPIACFVLVPAPLSGRKDDACWFLNFDTCLTRREISLWTHSGVHLSAVFTLLCLLSVVSVMAEENLSVVLHAQGDLRLVGDRAQTCAICIIYSLCELNWLQPLPSFLCILSIFQRKSALSRSQDPMVWYIQLVELNVLENTVDMQITIYRLLQQAFQKYMLICFAPYVRL